MVGWGEGEEGLYFNSYYLVFLMKATFNIDENQNSAFPVI